MITTALELRQLRYRLGLTQPQMAERMGMSMSGYHGVEMERSPFRKIHSLAASFVELESGQHMPPNQLHILQHALGLDEYGRGTCHRNRFVTGEGSSDHSDCLALVEAGLMTRRAAVALFSGDDIFTVTDAGKKAAVEMSPAAPKVPKEKQRYLDWLAYDGAMSFIDWLRWKQQQKRAA